MIVTKTYLSKCNTIVEGNPVNLSINPIMEINYGNMKTRGLIYFDHSRLKCLVEDKTYPDISKLHHVLKMTNCSSITSKHINKPCHTSEYDSKKERAISFDLIFFLIPNEWDDGRGFDYVYDLYNGSHRSISTDASNWYQYKNYYKWETEGIYSTDKLLKEYDLFSRKDGNKSNIIIAKQHFEYGNENIAVDLTEIINKFIMGEIPNYGIGIAFAPYYENNVTQLTQYVGFFTQHTHSFYEPYIETTYDEYIEDDRSNFYLDKDNKLYFYSNIHGFPANLDELPICTIEGQEIAVKQATKGVYYAEVNLSSENYEDETMLYDIWDNIKYKGREFKPVELSFITKSSSDYFSFGLPGNNDGTSTKKESYNPSVYGINDDETIKRGDIRKVNIECKIPYSTNKLYSVDGIYYRLYVMEGEKELDVINWLPVERGFNENYFLINTNDLIPFRYYIDIKTYQGNEVKVQHKILCFDIVNDVTDEKQ